MPDLRRSSIILGLVAAATLVGAVAQAAIPDTGSAVFHGCVSKRTGILRVIDPSTGAKCLTIRGLEETPIEWNQVGPTGPPGPPATPAGLVSKHVKSYALTSTGFTTQSAECDPGDIPVNGYWTVDGKQPGVNGAVVYSLGDNRETATGFQVRAYKEFGYTGPDPLIEITVVCLNVA